MEQATRGRTRDKQADGAINWKASLADGVRLTRIVQRADALARKHGQQPIPQLIMDLTACHLNGTPLDLDRLLAADDFNFTHDVWGIHRHIDRTTGRLRDCFLPRFATPSTKEGE